MCVYVCVWLRGVFVHLRVSGGADIGTHMHTQALLAASGRVREMQDKEHLAGFGIEVGEVKYDREKVAAHAANLVSTVAKNLGGSLTALGVDQVMCVCERVCV